MEDQLSKRLDRIEELQLRTREDIAALKVKASVWGALGGLIPVIITLAYMLTK